MMRRQGQRRWARSDWLVSIAVLTVICSVSVPTMASAASAYPSYCSSSFDPYQASAAVLAACGMTKTPAQITANSDGSTTYRYDVDGTVATSVIPPSGFDPDTASAADLARYSYPHQPSLLDVAA